MEELTERGKSDSPRHRKISTRRLRRGVVLYVLIPYLSVAGMLTLLQRSLIYFPTRDASIRPQQTPLPAGQVHTILAVAEDGVQLHGWHVLAEGRTATSPEACNRELAAGRWLVLYFPGNAGNRSYRVRDCQDFTRLGADVFLFDYRGYGENRGSPSEAALTADARRIWEFATVERGVAPGRILLFGESLGGAIATQLAAEMCEKGTPPAGLILSSAFSSLVETARWHYPFLPVGMLLWDRYRAVEWIPKVTCPVLHIHGARDSIVPIELGRRLFEKAQQSSAGGIEKQFIELPAAGHNDIPHAAFHDAVGKFLRSLDGLRSAQQSAHRRAGGVRQ